MKTVASWGSVVLLAVLCAGLAPSAEAAPTDSGAQADSKPRFSLTVNRETLVSGQRLVATATASVRCDWIVRWNGERRHQNAKTLVSTFLAPEVTRKTTLALQARCFYDQSTKKQEPPAAAVAAAAAAAAKGTSEILVVRVPPSWSHTIVITVLPPGSVVSPPGDGGNPHPGGGGLPNTGGPRLWLLLAGLASVLAGSVAVRRSRRGDPQVAY